jgi:H+-transporting ATPase
MSVRIVKGAYDTVIALTQPSTSESAAGSAAVTGLEADGLRVLAVAAGSGDNGQALRLVGLIALDDPPRSDSAALTEELQLLGVRTVMVTGDAPATAAAVAHSVGLDGPMCPAATVPADIDPAQFGVFAGIFPEGKYDLVKAFQKTGHTVGM